MKWVLAAEILLAFAPLPFFYRNLKPPPEGPCAARYAFLHQRPDPEIRVIFGYKDTRPTRYVGDRYERIYFARRLEALGFVMDPEDADLYRLRTPWRTWRVRLIHSSVSPDDDANRRDSFQTWQSEYATRLFYEGLNEAEVVLYNGHSRDGGGPDFTPPKITKSQHLDYYWYRVQQPGLKRLLKTLRESEKTSRVLGVFSCAADVHFSQAIGELKTEIGLVSSRELIYHFDALRNLEGMVTAVVGNFCRSAMDSAIEAESMGGKTKVEGFLARE